VDSFQGLLQVCASTLRDLAACCIRGWIHFLHHLSGVSSTCTGCEATARLTQVDSPIAKVLACMIGPSRGPDSRKVRASDAAMRTTLQC
jgi:hypothetical protein